jgi:hypothetical protein
MTCGELEYFESGSRSADCYSKDPGTLIMILTYQAIDRLVTEQQVPAGSQRWPVPVYGPVNSTVPVYCPAALLLAVSPPARKHRVICNAQSQCISPTKVRAPEMHVFSCLALAACFRCQELGFKLVDMLARASIDRLRSKLREEDCFTFQPGKVAQLQFLLKEAAVGSDLLSVFSGDDWACLAKKCSLVLFQEGDPVFTRGIDAQHIGLILQGRCAAASSLPSVYQLIPDWMHGR